MVTDNLAHVHQQDGMWALTMHAITRGRKWVPLTIGTKPPSSHRIHSLNYHT